MKAEYIKIFSLLIALFYVNILELNNLRKRNKSSNKNDIEYFRLLDDEYDTSKRNNKDDIDSIEKAISKYSPDFIVNSSRAYPGLKYGSISWNNVRAYGIWTPLSIKFTKNIM
jgi:hypothetical protein